MVETVSGKKVTKSFVDYLPTWLKNTQSLFYYFLFMLLLGVLFFCTSLFVQQFTTPFSGDYSAQQISFYTNGYDDWWHFFTTGEFVFYDTNTFLGANNIGSNSFYYLFDPFFMPILMCPRQFIAQGMAILTIFKMAASGMMFFLYMRYMGASRRSAKITGIAYAFSGWTTWYLWFNHFTDIAIVLPLMLLGVEMILKEKKPWVLALSICMMGFVNYFFCICFVLCAFIYAMFRFFQRIRMFNWKDNCLFLLIGFFAFAIGIMLACFAILPSAMVALNSSRAETASYLTDLKNAVKSFDLGTIFKLLTSWKGTSSDTWATRNEARPYYFLIELMFPVTTDRGTPLLDYHNDYGSYDNVAGSLYCFMPMMVLFTPALIKSTREKHFTPLIATILFILALLSPFFYFAFFGFTQPYSRWFLFPVFCLIAYVGLYLDKFKEDELWTLGVGAIVAALLTVLAALMAHAVLSKYGTGTNDYYTERVPLVLVTCLMLVHIAGIYVALRFTKKTPHFHTAISAIVCVEIVLMGAFVIEGHGVSNYVDVNQGLDNNNELHSLVEQTRSKDNTYYRSYSSLAGSSAVNDGMRNNYNGSTFFHSLYNYNTDDIRGWQYISTGSWSGTYTEKRIGTDTLLGVKYYYVEDDYFDYYSSSRKATASPDFRYNVPFGYKKVTSEYKNNGLFNVYKNNDYIDFALTYDSIYNKYEGYGLSVIDSETIFFNSAIISEKSSSPGSNVINGFSNINKYDEFKGVGRLSTALLARYPNLYIAQYNEGQTVKEINLKKYSSIAPNDYGVTFYDTRSAPSASGEVKKAISLPVDEMINVDTSSYDKYGSVSYPSSFDYDADYSRYIAVINCPVGKSTEQYDENGMIYYLNNSYEWNKKVDIYFVDDNNKVVTFDNHSDTRFTSGWGSKNLRAFYITPGADGKAPHISKIVIVSRSYKLENTYRLYFDTYTNYLNHLQEFKDYPVTDVKSATSVWKFKTNFDHNRIITTRLAYEDGFTVTAKNEAGKKENIPVFMSQGGFLSFVSGVGNYSYEIEFYPPGLSLGRTIAAIGSFVLLSSMVAYIYMSHYINKDYPVELFGVYKTRKKKFSLIR